MYKSITVNGQAIKRVVANGVTIWQRSSGVVTNYDLTGYQSLTINRAMSLYSSVLAITSDSLPILPNMVGYVQIDGAVGKVTFEEKSGNYLFWVHDKYIADTRGQKDITLYYKGETQPTEGFVEKTFTTRIFFRYHIMIPTATLTIDPESVYLIAFEGLAIPVTYVKTVSSYHYFRYSGFDRTGKWHNKATIHYREREGK